jgi:hypothetical protein
LSQVRRLLLGVLLISVVLVLHSQTPTHAFFVRIYNDKCLDFTSATQAGGAPVVIATCNYSATQQIVVQEINARHEVVFHAGQKVVGVHQPLVVTTGNAPFVNLIDPTLELQAPAQPTDLAFRNQVFALDGDSIILVSNRSLVAQAKDNRSTNGTPVIMGARNLSYAEFWDFTAVTGADEDPTSGFIRVSSRDTLLNAITQVNQVASSNNGAAWGSVIKIDPSMNIELTYAASLFCAPTAPYQCSYDGTHNRFYVHNLLIPGGVTVRGGRRFPVSGALLHGDYGCTPLNGDDPCTYQNVFQVQGEHARITGLRIEGPIQCVPQPDSCHSTNLPLLIGVQVGSRVAGAAGADVIVDHNELFDWPEAGVNIASNLDAADICPGPAAPAPNYIFVTRNYFHHNENNDGYGVGIYGGGAARLVGNVFLMNRHSISGGNGEVHNQYNAAYNLVLSDVPVYGGNREQDFDMHGTEQPGHWFGGFAGGPVDIHSNTFLGGNRPNYEQRGEPCNTSGVPTSAPLDMFDFNVTMNSSPVFIIGRDGSTKSSVSYNGPAPSSTPYVSFRGNQLAQNPTGHLGVGDFDGDGKDDLFLATGAAWYYSPGGSSEWHFLNAQTDPIDALLFGDFDGDGRTDVLTKHGRDVLVSWGGASNWETINELDGNISDMAIGDFDGDHRADIFYSNGQEWLVASGGSGPFKLFDTSSFRVANLRFGDFNGDGKTDVFGVANGAWSVTYGGTVNWTRLRDKLSDSVAGLLVADFDGDGRADVVKVSFVFPSGLEWQISRDGTGDWKPLRLDQPSKQVAAVGHFGLRRGSDMLLWNGDSLDISPGGSATPFRFSANEMR